MKHCPTCNAGYPDDGPTFCLNDGARLNPDAPPASFDPQKTMLAPPPPAFNPPPNSFQNPQGGAQGYQGGMPSQPPYQQPQQQQYQQPQPPYQQPQYQPQQPPQWGSQPQPPRPLPYGGGTASGAAVGIKDKLQPALIGGLVAGVPTILPFIGRGFCLWAAVGGLVAGMMYIRRSPVAVKIPDGLMVGLMAGVISALMLIVIGLPLSFAVGRTSGYFVVSNQSYSIVPFIIMGGLIGGFFLALFGAIGGLLSVPLFEKRNTNTPNFPMPPPPPPPNYGGPAGGGYR